MKNIVKLLIGCVAAAGIASSASAQISLSLSPSSQSVGLNGVQSFDLNISGLKGSADYSGPALGGFEVTLDYDSTIASAQSVTFGSMLNLSGSDFQYSDTTTTPGVITIEEISYDSASALEAAQGKSFTLATFTLQGINLGSTAITFDLSYGNTSLSDENAHTLDLAGGAIGASLKVVPEPGTCTMALMGLGLLGLRARNRAGRNS